MRRPPGAPDTLRDTAQSAYDDSKALLQDWHGSGRARYAITPRFAPPSTPEQLDFLQVFNWWAVGVANAIVCLVSF